MVQQARHIKQSIKIFQAILAAASSAEKNLAPYAPQNYYVVNLVSSLPLYFYMLKLLYLQLMEAISGMVEEMLEETKQKYKSEAEKAVELAKMAAELEKETFKLEMKRDVSKVLHIIKVGFVKAVETKDRISNFSGDIACFTFCLILICWSQDHQTKI